MSKKAVVVIPTYNEALSIGEMITYLFEKTFQQTDWDCSLLVVDGNSPDGTAEIVRQAQSLYPQLHLIVETKKAGLGAAYFQGFRYAEDQLGAEVVIEFDGDFQHPPETIPELLKRIDAGDDLVLGSRKRKGGSYPKKWDLLRLFFSVVGGLVTRIFLFFPTRSFWQVTDPTTGLKATRVDQRFRDLDFDNFKSRGFGYKIEMLYKLVRAGAKVGEIPLNFQVRDVGESKMTGQTPFEIFGAALNLRLKDRGTRRFIKFGLVGLSGWVINAVALEFFVNASFVKDLAASFSVVAQNTLFGFVASTAAWAAALAIECSIVNNYLWNNFWTFHLSRARHPVRFLGKFLQFNLTSVGSILIQFMSVGLATHTFGNTMLVRQLALVLTIGFLIIPYNWFMYNKLIWRKKTV